MTPGRSSSFGPDLLRGPSLPQNEPPKPRVERAHVPLPAETPVSMRGNWQRHPASMRSPLSSQASRACPNLPGSPRQPSMCCQTGPPALNAHHVRRPSMLTSWHFATSMCCKPGQPALSAQKSPRAVSAGRLALRTFDVLQIRQPALNAHHVRRPSTLTSLHFAPSM